MLNKLIIVLLGIVGVLAIIALLVTYLANDGRHLQSPVDVAPPQGGTVCTMDAMQCPDGSYVGRTGPNCEFICPSVSKPGAGSSGANSKYAEDMPGTVPPAEPPKEEDMVMCSMDAMQCPDGSYVGRTGPKCEFICPETEIQKTGTLSATIFVGPTCPVVREGEEERCADKPYKGTVRVEGHEYDSIAVTDVEGFFSLSLPYGTYRITRNELEPTLPSCDAEVVINSAVVTKTLTCDSGIR